MTPEVECSNCENTIDLPSGLKFVEIGSDGSRLEMKGVSCPWCFEEGDKHIIPAEKVKEALEPSV